MANNMYQGRRKHAQLGLLEERPKDQLVWSAISMEKRTELIELLAEMMLGHLLGEDRRE